MPKSRAIFLVIALLVACAQAPSAPETDRSAGPADGVIPRNASVLNLDGERSLGSPSAKLVLIEFADYQCPYCRRFHVGTLPKLQRAYIDTGVLRYFYKDLPLPMHAQAFPASVAAYCAGVQGQYWPMHEQLYEDQARLGDALFDEIARKLGLDMDRFKACRQKDSEATPVVRRDMREARTMGINATPTFVLARIEAGRVVVKRVSSGSPSFEVFAKEIEALRE
ncbi:MAG: DsbA family protein [Gammaproteobacteria bacterium]|nr:DsbA family protein [Gammaproteobacteria bacterium]